MKDPYPSLELDEKPLVANGASPPGSPFGEKAMGYASNSDSNGKAADDEKKDKDAKENKAGIRDYFRIFQFADGTDRALYATSLLAAMAAGATLPLMTLVFGQFTATFNDFATGTLPPDDFKSEVDHFVLYFVYLFFGRFFLSYGSSVLINIAASRTTRAFRRRFLEATLRQEVWHFDKQTNGSAATQVTTNGNRVTQGIGEKLATLVQGISLFFSAFIIALAVQWKLALIIMSMIPALFLVVGICIAFDAKVEAKVTKFYSRAAVLAQDAISSVRTIHAFGAEEKIIRKYDEYLEMAYVEGKKKNWIYAVLFSTQNFLVLSSTALAFWQGYRMFASREIDNVGTVFTVVLSVAIATTAIGMVAPQQLAITNASSAASELFEIIDKPSLLDPLAPEGIVPDFVEGRIEIRNLKFAYPSRPTAPVLQGLNISLPAGKTTALVGPSGCGKSTLIGLIERWYLPSSGDIYLDGAPVSEYNMKWLRSAIRLVQQEPVLFRGTVFQNVARGFVGDQANLPHEKQLELVQEACKQSNAHDFIMELPEAYDTAVGERAAMLSGGQRQRVAIARSIISNPKVLLLDEATSALDPRAERIVQDALDRVSADKTTLIIAHKLATVRKADNIAVMTEGRVVEQGTHSELVALDGLYASMVRSQDLGAKSGEEAQIADDDDEGGLEPAMTLQRPKSEVVSAAAQAKLKKLTAETMNYSLLRSIWVMFGENRKRLWLSYVIAVVGSLIAGATYPVQAIIFSRLINVFTIRDRSEAQNQANFFALMFFVLALANLFAYAVIGWCCNIIGQVVTKRYRLEMVRRVLNFDQDFFDRPQNGSGSLTSKLSSVPTALQELISANIFLMLIVMVNVFASSILGIVYGWKLGLVIVFGAGPFLLGSGYIRIRMDQKLEAEAGERFADSASLATEAVTSIRTISSLTLESQILDEYAAAMDAIVKSASKGFVVTMIPYAFSQSVEFLALALGFWYGSRLLASGEYDTSQFFVVFISVVFGFQAAGQFFGYTTSITKAKAAANYILWLRTVESQIAETPQNKYIGPSSHDGPVEMENVDFRYLQRPDARVLRGIDIKIEPGTYCAFVGPSGCGKSTLVALLMRFYDPARGRITLNHEDIAKMSPRLYRNHISMVQQEPPLYQGTVRENIALGLQFEPSDEEINEACRQSNALDFVSSLPEGLETQCGSKGSSFSGGQKQRIAVARALIRKPRLLLLDEATSALDTQSERIVQIALDEAASTRTTIAVAHRLSTIKHANTIFVVADGKIAEMGTHQELQALRGRYYAMCLAQSLDQA
ncbi:unnamed protein product [Zymoseptoria tritici ST99CH_1A5]|uniref:ABC transporter n=1 Tax=Zymoseptoria tritici ST99CH_1A5 TaxID=1276529 RepID=A0A1Y6LDR6_ZYMTR|nr:unnamed protein product [Zymoseptoria tritici ST99CH_1A5]